MQAGLNMYDLLMAVDVKSLKNERDQCGPEKQQMRTLFTHYLTIRPYCQSVKENRLIYAYNE